MNKELITDLVEDQDSFTAELQKAVNEILNRFSDEELDRLLQAEDRTFLNQVTPEGKPLVNSRPEKAGLARTYSSGVFTLTTKFYALQSIDCDVHFVPKPSEAADRQDLALAA